MPVIQRVVKPKTRRGKRFLESHAPKVIEGDKELLFMKGNKVNEVVSKCLKDLYLLKKPGPIFYNNKNNILPFEDVVPVEKFCKKHNTSIFAFGSSNKKRPNCLILGRTYHHQLLDMVEFSIENFKSLEDFHNEKTTQGIKPCLLFVGDTFDHNYEYKRVKSMFIDFFQRTTVENLRLQGLEHVLLFTAAEGKIYFRSYRIMLKKSGSKTPRIELEEIGPSMDFILGRTKLASDDLFKLACKKSKELQAKKKKNLSEDAFGSEHGRIHLGKQDIQKIQTRKMKGLKKTKEEKKRKLQESNTENSKKQKITET